MSINPLNDISRVYLDQIAESAIPGKPAEKLGAVTSIPKSEQDAARERTLAKAKAMREKKGIKESAKPDYLDFDNDGNEKESMKKALKDKAKKKIEEAKKVKAKRWWDDDGDGIGYEKGEVSGKFKKKSVKEGYSNWREDLCEVIDKIESKKNQDQKITEKNINNKITINPKLDLGETVENLGGTLVEMVELDEEFIFESANISAEYFCEQGLNEFGVEILIEELGLDEFVNFVFDINNEIISEARSGGVRIEPVTAKGQKFKSGKPTGKSLERLRKLKAERKASETKVSASKPSGMKAALQRQSAIASAKKQQPKKKGVLNRVAGAVLKGMERHQKATSSARQAFQKGMERHKAATATATHLAKETGKTVTKAGKIAKHVAKSAATGASQTAKGVKKVVVGEEIQIDEKVLTAAETKKKEELVKSMKSKAADFEKRYPGRGKEVMYATATKMAKKMAEQAMELQPKTSQPKEKPLDTAAERQKYTNLKMMQQKQQQLQKQKLNLQKQGKLPLESESYELDGEVIDERRREEKGTPRKPRDPAFELVAKSMGAGRMGVQSRGQKKIKGQKPPAASPTPAQKVAKLRAAAQRAQDMMHSKFD